MSSRAKRLFLSPFMFWVATLVVGSYFLFSIDMSVFQKEAPEGKTISFVQKLMKAVSIPRMNLGIDLQGGAHGGRLEIGGFGI